jgi:ribonuclease P protein component
MLPKAQRLTREAFMPAMWSGKRRFGQYMTVTVSPIEHGSFVCGVVVSKKVVKHAVDRHKLRRWVYEALRAHSEHLTGKSVIVVLTPRARDVGYETLCSELHTLLP